MRLHEAGTPVSENLHIIVVAFVLVTFFQGFSDC